MWPISIYKGGTQYGYCPAKATWDEGAVSLFRKLVLSTETSVMLESGGINDQPDWFIEQLSWFAPRYKETKLMSLIERLMRGMPGLSRLAGGKRGDNPRTAPR